MSTWGLQVKNTSANPCWLLKTTSSIKVGIFGSQVFRQKVHSFGCRRSSLVVRAKAKKNNGNNNNPNGSNDSKGRSSSDGENLNDNPSQDSLHLNLYWRKFRANMIEIERAEANANSQSETKQESKPLGLKWAHPLSTPENGCILVATEKLDGARTFERSVVLLLRSGIGHPQEGPFGVVISRPLNRKIWHMKPSNTELATTFADCLLHFGGPLEASMFLVKAEDKSNLQGFEEVIPGLCFGARNNLEDAAALVKKGILTPQDFRFFVGYAGWQFDQLREEIESGYWYLAACSLDLIYGGASSSSSESLWEEILQLMGGHYSELSRKPKQDT